MRTLRVLAGLAALAAPACADEPDDLDPDVVNRLTRTAGNATGFDLGGDFAVSLRELDCSQCPALLFFPQVDMCGGLGAFGSGSPTGNTVETAAHLVHSDGTLLIETADIAATGPVDSDGAFATGRVLDLTTVISRGGVVARIDGELSEDEGTLHIEGILRQRIDGRFGEIEAHCEQSFEVSGVRL